MWCTVMMCRPCHLGQNMVYCNNVQVYCNNVQVSTSAGCTAVQVSLCACSLGSVLCVSSASHVYIQTSTATLCVCFCVLCVHSACLCM